MPHWLVFLKRHGGSPFPMNVGVTGRPSQTLSSGCDVVCAHVSCGGLRGRNPSGLEDADAQKPAAAVHHPEAAMTAIRCLGLIAVLEGLADNADSGAAIPPLHQPSHATRRTGDRIYRFDRQCVLNILHDLHHPGAAQDNGADVVVFLRLQRFLLDRLAR